ncbi:DUF3800 domain-containing protein [Thermococcus sp.]|uniref:DUF3800 domain-containing protein n=1 Tax=Thermococcus sp. TaxID=35749 RepID=UPI002609F969|nr:DUF3800 domain-containing protein [Thermococcus sp.]
MVHIYIVLDEAGDMGFSKGSSRYFVMGAIIARAEHAKKIRRIPKKAREKLGKKKRDVPELKASKSNDKIRKFVLDRLYKCASAHVSAVYVNKANTYDYIRERGSQKAVHYNYLSRVLIVDSLKPYRRSIGYTPDKALTIEIFLDRYHTTKFRKRNLEEYIRKMIMEAFPHEVKVFVHQKDSQGEPLIQVADFVANAFYRKLNENEDLLQRFERSGRILKFKQLY